MISAQQSPLNFDYTDCVIFAGQVAKSINNTAYSPSASESTGALSTADSSGISGWVVWSASSGAEARFVGVSFGSSNSNKSYKTTLHTVSYTINLFKRLIAQKQKVNIVHETEVMVHFTISST